MNGVELSRRRRRDRQLQHVLDFQPIRNKAKTDIVFGSPVLLNYGGLPPGHAGRR
jgi:hypothetical protein